MSNSSSRSTRQLSAARSPYHPSLGGELHGYHRTRASRQAEEDPAVTDYIWKNARLLTLDVAVAREVAGDLLPKPLRLAHPARATLFVADYPETSFGSAYREAAILLSVEDEAGAALHCPWMVVDDDAALILGREVLGFPKKMAEIRLEERTGGVVGRVVRKDVEVLRIEATLSEVEHEPAPLFGRMVNAIGTPITGMQLIELPGVSQKIHKARCGAAQAQLTSSERDPLGVLKAFPLAPARYLTLSFGDAGKAGEQSPKLLGPVDDAWVAQQFFARAM